jgi:hypothetical protein
MKKFFVALTALALMAVSCREFEPVFTFKYADTPVAAPVSDDYAMGVFGVSEFTTINALKALYTAHGKPIEIEEPMVLRAQVVSSDESGNVYREIYLQDATGAIDFKVGRSSSYDDYKPGQILYVNCLGLTLGEYGYKDKDYNGCGQLQLGLKRNMSINPSTGDWEDADDYETAYIDLEPVLRAKVLKGVILPADDPDRILPNDKLTGADILSYGYVEVVKQKKNPTDYQTKINHPLVGQLVSLKGLKYANEVFLLFYPNPNLNHTSNDPKNRVFISMPDEPEAGVDYTYGVKWWALTKNRFTLMVEDGANNGWDNLEVGSGNDHYGPIATTQTDMEFFGVEMPYKYLILTYPSAQSVSQYFEYQGSPVAIRTSGYARFADKEIPAAVRNGSETIDVVGILSRYQGAPQITMLDAWLSSDTAHENSIIK